jgi:hypothetical protein
MTITKTESPFDGTTVTVTDDVGRVLYFDEYDDNCLLLSIGHVEGEQIGCQFLLTKEQFAEVLGQFGGRVG